MRETCQRLVDALNGPARHASRRREGARAASGQFRVRAQGLYEPDEITGSLARITVWMRTAKKENVVKFRTFLRTLLHEVCHHLDYELYKLDRDVPHRRLLRARVGAGARAARRAAYGLRTSRFGFVIASRASGSSRIRPCAQRSAMFEYHGERKLPDWPVEWMKSDRSRSARS